MNLTITKYITKTAISDPETPKILVETLITLL